MKTTFLSVCILLMAFYSCSENQDDNNQLNLKVSLNLKECVDISEVGAKICLDSIVGDSRCPDGVVCVWEGDGIARFSIQKTGDVKYFELHTQTNFRRDTIIDGLKISLENLTPHPEVGSEIDQKNYTVLINVSEE